MMRTRSFTAAFLILAMAQASVAPVAWSEDLGFQGSTPLPSVTGLGPKRAESLLRVSFDCFLDSLACQDVTKAFFAADPFITDAGRDPKADVVVKLRVWHLPPDIEQ